MRFRRESVGLPARAVRQIEALRDRAAVGDERPARAAVIRAATERGLMDLCREAGLDEAEGTTPLEAA